MFFKNYGFHFLFCVFQLICLKTLGLELGFHPGWADAMEQHQMPPGETSVGSGGSTRGSGGHNSQLLHVPLPSSGGVSQVQGEDTASEIWAGEHVPSRRASAHHAFEQKTLTPEQ